MTQTEVVPAASGRAFRLAAGNRITVVDIAGGQVGDLFAFSAADPSEYLSAAHTRAVRQRLFPLVGEDFVTNLRRPILTLLDDTSPGKHDMLIPACDPRRYEQLGAVGWHPSCEENLQLALGAEGIAVACAPQPVNVFMDAPVSDDGTIPWNPAPTKAGDTIVFRAVSDVIVVLAACSMDLTDLNHRRLTDLGVMVDA